MNPIVQTENQMKERSALALRVIFLAGIVLALGLSTVLPRQAFASAETYVLMADTHLGLPNDTTYGEVEDALMWADSLDNLKAVAVAGDLTDRGDEVAYSDWEFLFASIMEDGVARIQAMGDHDTGLNGEYLKVDPLLTVKNGRANFIDCNGGAITSYTKFSKANIMTIGGVRAKGYSVITNGMLKELNSRLKQTMRQGKMAIVVCHYPYNNRLLNKRAKLMGILRSYPNVIFVSGHMHRYSGKAQCQSVKPPCSRTPYNRAGFNENTKYAIRSVGVNALSSYRSGSRSFADELRIEDSGRISLKRWDVGNEQVEKTWSFKQAKSSVVVKAAATAKGKRKSPSGTFVYRVKFSDGKTYGGVKSGGTFKLRAGKTKRFSSIPSGVLVTVSAVKAPSGWSKAKSKSVEVGKRSKKAVMTSKKKAGGKVSAKSTGKTLTVANVGNK